MAVWWEVILQFLLGILNQIGSILGVQFLNFEIFWQLLPIYSTWFAIQFITRNREEEDLANRFMNGFALLWVGFQLGEYIIENFFIDPYIFIKLLVVIGLFLYAFFIMRLTLQKKDITRYIARIGEISAVNIAAMLFVQDLLIITDGIQLIQMIIGFFIIYISLDFGFEKLVEFIYGRVKIPIAEKEEAKPAEAAPKPPTVTPRYERITRPPAVRPRPQPIRRPQPMRPAAPQAVRPPAPPTTVAPPPPPPTVTPPKPPVRKVEVK